MTLDTQATHPHTHSYVIRLHRDAAPERGVFMGRLQHIYTGEQYEFRTAEQLLACLVRGAALIAAAARESSLKSNPRIRSTP
jgi:hypothetical protein